MERILEKNLRSFSALLNQIPISKISAELRSNEKSIYHFNYTSKLHFFFIADAESFREIPEILAEMKEIKKTSNKLDKEMNEVISAIKF